MREHSRAELERKLLQRLRQRTVSHPVSATAGPNASCTEDVGNTAACGDGHDEDLHEQHLRAEIDKALDDLQAKGLLSDQRAADALLLAKAPRYGSRRLKQLLQAKSLDADLVSSTLGRARSTEFDRALAVWQRRFGAPPVDLREHARQQRFLAARGFEAAIITRVLKQAGASASSAADD
jgi:regulatory protein